MFLLHIIINKIRLILEKIYFSKNQVKKTDLI